MARLLIFSAMAAFGVALGGSVSAASADPAPGADAAYKHYFDEALKNQSYSARLRTCIG